MSNDSLFYKDNKKRENNGDKPPKTELDFLKFDLNNMGDSTVKTKLRIMINDLYGGL